MITVLKKMIIIKKKEGKRQGKKRTSDETRTWDLYLNIKVLSQGHEGYLTLTLQKALIYITLPKWFKTCKIFSKKTEGKVISDRLDYYN